MSSAEVDTGIGVFPVFKADLAEYPAVLLGSSAEIALLHALSEYT